MHNYFAQRQNPGIVTTVSKVAGRKWGLGCSYACIYSSSVFYGVASIGSIFDTEKSNGYDQVENLNLG